MVTHYSPFSTHGLRSGNENLETGGTVGGLVQAQISCGSDRRERGSRALLEEKVGYVEIFLSDQSAFAALRCCSENIVATIIVNIF